MTPEQIAHADRLGRARQRDAEKKRRRAGRGASDDPVESLRRHIWGARSEMAYRAWATLRCCRPVWNDFRESIYDVPDFAPDVDVRYGRTRKSRLIVAPDAPAHWRYLLVDAFEHPTYFMVGWKWGDEAKQEMWLKDYADAGRERNAPAHFVPRLALDSMEHWAFSEPEDPDDWLQYWHSLPWIRL